MALEAGELTLLESISVEQVESVYALKIYFLQMLLPPNATKPNSSFMSIDAATSEEPVTYNFNSAGFDVKDGLSHSHGVISKLKVRIWFVGVSANPEAVVIVLV